MCGFPFAPIQILTGDIREGCHARHSRLHDVGRSLPPKSRIERRFESLPGVQRFANLWRAFWFFLHDAKRIKSFSLQRTSRFCKPRISPPEQQLHTNKIKSFPKGRIEVLQTSNQRTKLQLPTNPMKSFAASRLFFPLRGFFRRLRRLFFPPCGGPMLLPQHFLPPPAAQKGPQPSRLRSFLTRFARPLCTIAVRILRLPFPRVLAHIL